MDREDLPCGYCDELQAAFESEAYQAWLDAKELELLTAGLPAVVATLDEDSFPF